VSYIQPHVYCSAVLLHTPLLVIDHIVPLQVPECLRATRPPLAQGCRQQQARRWLLVRYVEAELAVIYHFPGSLHWLGRRSSRQAEQRE
jgi:hypothetical protein